MKKIKFLIPLSMACATIAPIAAMTSCSCGMNNDVTIDKKEITCGDSYTTYKVKLPKVPTNKKVSVQIINATADQEQVIIDTEDLPTSNVAVSLNVADDGTVEIPVCYAYAPTQSSSSKFGLKLTTDDGASYETGSTDLKFDYTVDYDVDLKDGTYDPETQSKVTPAAASHWSGKTAEQIAAAYMDDVLEQPIRFQSDARYSTSKNIKVAIDDEEIKGLSSFKAYFNNVYKDDYGLNVQMNYEVKSGSEGEFQFVQLQTTGNHRRFTFKNFDLACNFMTANGYKFAWDGTDPKHFNLTDEHGQYDLVGRMKGTFTSKVERYSGSTWEVVSAEQTINYDDLITLDETNEESYSNRFISFMFAFGLIHLTYDFDWGTETPALKILSNYAKNA